ncbi:expressed unknown protein [Seminavis robusta]|uniref:Uncharacterized protein n=1 Tax=Seminavis robusta TaxID=568900 RepID=A0A9N8H7S7_9STRA|nr:expressed unknown protein [Seminavis robusta]|eukprot:Sro214_g088641.1  (172) ;mRNA; f:14142-14657
MMMLWRVEPPHAFVITATLILLYCFQKWWSFVVPVHVFPQHSTSSPRIGTDHTSALLLTTTLCEDKCQSHCREYQTPFYQCFQGAALFPNDPSWNATGYILDFPLNHSHFQRQFFDTTNTYPTTLLVVSACQGTPTDEFVLPFRTCVGPFGKPRPWGTFDEKEILNVAKVQ